MADDRRLGYDTLDGNAAGGVLRDLFGTDVTAARTTCAGCLRVAAVGELALYGHQMGTILRCPRCDAVILRLARVRDRYWLDLRGTVSLVIPV